MDTTVIRPARSSRVSGGIGRLVGVMPAAVMSPTATYVMRTLLAMALALYSCFLLQLPSPGSAMITVMIVANPARGAIISKGAWRIFGTLTGALASIVIIACFAQSSLLFLLAFSAWLGGCVFVSSMFRHFRAYAAVLSGYTVAIISFGALAHPDNILILALMRLAVVTIGVVSSTVVTMVFQPGITQEAVFRRGVDAVRAVAGLIHAHTAGMADAPFQAERARLAGEIEQLDEAVEFAGVEAFGVHVHAPSLRRGFAALYAALVTTSTVGILSTITTRPLGEETRAIIAGADALLAQTAAVDPQNDMALDLIAARLSAMIGEIALLQDNARITGDVAALARVQQVIQDLHDCLATLTAWRAGRLPFHGSAKLRSFKDFDVARRNALRAMIATILAGLFWYETAWSYGGLLLLFVGVVSALVSSAPSAAAASVNFAKGATLATFIAPICGFIMLPYVSGFPLMFASMLPFLAVGIHATTKPQYALMALAFVIFFTTGLSLANPMDYDFQSFLNNGLATIAGAGTGALVFRIVIPPDPARDARHLIRGIRQTVQRLTDRRFRPWYPNDPLGWQVIANQRLQRLLMRLMFQPKTRSMAIGGAGALLITAQQILALREDLPKLALPSDVKTEVDAAIDRLGNLADPAAAGEASLGACRVLSNWHDDMPGHRADVLRAGARFRIIAAQMPEAAKLLALETTCRMQA